MEHSTNTKACVTMQNHVFDWYPGEISDDECHVSTELRIYMVSLNGVQKVFETGVLKWPETAWGELILHM